MDLLQSLDPFFGGRTTHTKNYSPQITTNYLEFRKFPQLQQFARNFTNVANSAIFPQYSTIFHRIPQYSIAFHKYFVALHQYCTSSVPVFPQYVFSISPVFPQYFIVFRSISSVFHQYFISISTVFHNISPVFLPRYFHSISPVCHQYFPSIPL